MLICDSLAAATTLGIGFLMLQGTLEIWHLYILNAVNGFMNTLQQPSSEVAITLVTPKKHYARAGALRMFSNSLNTLLVPIFATSLYALFGMQTILLLDLISFGVAFIALAFFIKLPAAKAQSMKKEPLLSAVSYTHLAENDMEMIKTVKYGIAMGNAMESLKKAAWDVTDTNDQMGIAKALDKYVVTAGE